MKKGSWFTLLLVLALVQTIAVAQQLTQNQEERIQKLEKVIAQQQEHIDALQQKLQQTDEMPAQPSQDSSYAEKVAQEYVNSPEAEEQAVGFGYEDGKGFFIRGANLELYMTGLIQMGVGIFENDTPDDNSVYPNGVALYTDVYFYKDWHGCIQINFHEQAFNFQGPLNADGVDLWDAYVEYLGSRDEFGAPMVALRVGQTHVPFTIAGQWAPNQGPAIWAAPFIGGWSHGRDPGIMLWGVLSDMVEYKMSVHNGEGRTLTNATDDFLFAGSLRFYPLTRSKESDVFIHVGAIRARDNNGHDAGVAAASLATPWGRNVFDNRLVIDGDGDGLPDVGTDATAGWRTGVDAGISAKLDLGKDANGNVLNSVRVEGEFMYITWERSTAGVRYPFLEGFGASFALSFKHNLTPETPGAGIFPLFMVTYSDVDDKNTDDLVAGANIVGQRAWTYTAGLGYAFNDHISAQFNWVMVDLDEKDLYNTGGNAAKDDRVDGSDDIEHAWFVQFTAAW